MFTAEEMAEHRGDAESLMQDTFAGFAPGDPVVVSGMKKSGWIAMGTTLGKTQSPSRQGGDTPGRTVTIGDAQYTVLESGLHLPLSAYVVGGALLLRPGWEFQCTAIGPATDPAQLGRRWHVVEAPTKSWPTARRLDVAEVKPLDLG